MRFFSFVKIGFICVLFFLFACSKHSSTVPTFSVDVQQRDSIEHFFSGYDYVMLETNENTLLGNVERMKVDSSVIAVQDKGRILLFQHDGKFITKIDKLGRGAGEYLSVEDFCVKDSLVYILSRAQRRILVYDWKATFVDKIDLDDWYQHFEIVDDKLMFLSSEKSNEKQYDFVVFNYAKSEDMNMFSPFENNEGITFKNFTPFSGTFNGGYYVLRPFDYTVYRLSRTEFEPYCLFEFNTKEQIEQGAALVDLYDKTSNKNVVQYLGSYEEYNGSIYLTFTLFEEKHGIGTYVYKVESDGKNLLMKIYENFSDKYPYISAPYGVYDGAFYSIRPALDILNIEEMYGLSLFHDKGLTEESNHVVFFHKLK